MKRLISVILAALIILTFCACGADKDPEMDQMDSVSTAATKNETSSSGDYMIHELIPCPNADIKFADAVRAGENIVMYGQDGNRKTSFYIMNSATREINSIDGLPSEGVIDVGGLYDGSFAVLTANEDGNYTVIGVAPDGAISEPVELVAEYLQEDIATSIMPTENAWLIQTTTSLFIVDKAGKVIKDLGNYNGAMDIIYDSDNSLLLINTLGNAVGVDNSGGEVQVTVLDEQLNAKESYWLSNSYAAYYDVYDGELIAQASSTIFRINYRKDTRVPVSDSFISGISSSCFIQVEENCYFAFYKNAPAIWAANAIDAVTVLKMATYSINPTLYSAIYEFNNSNDRYIIEIVDYSIYDEAGSVDAGLVRMNADIVAGNAPDIYDLTHFQSTQLAASGKTEDLMPFFESAGLKPIANVVKALEYNGGLYILPVRFGVSALITNSEVANSEDWSISQLEKLIEEYGSEKLFGPEFDRSRFWQLVLIYSNKDLVNYETLECRFNSDEFENLIELSAYFPSYSARESDSDPFGRAFFGEQFFLEDQTLNIIQLAFNAATFGGDAEYLPFPVSGKPGLAVYPFFPLGMSSSSDCKAGVWEFFKFVLETDNLFYGIPFLSSKLDGYIKEASDLPYPTYTLMTAFDGQAVAIETAEIGEEKKSQLKLLIERVSVPYRVDDMLHSTISELTMPYYAGEKTAHEVAEMIQARVEIYLAEQYG